MKKLVFFALILSACKNETKPPHTFRGYDSIAKQLISEKNSGIEKLNKEGNNQAALDWSRIYTHKIDSVHQEQYKYYPNGMPADEVEQLKKEVSDSLNRTYQKY